MEKVKEKQVQKNDKKRKAFAVVKATAKGVSITLQIVFFIVGLLFVALLVGIGVKFWEVIAPAFGV